MQQSLLQAPTVEPISVDQALCHLREDEDDAQIDLIKGLIRAARQYVENYTRRVLVRQTWRLTYDCFPSLIELPILPVRAVSSVKYIDTADTEQTLATSVYQSDLSTDDRARIMPVFGETWPTIQSLTFNAVTVEVIAGYAVPFTTDFGSDANQLDATAHPLSDDDVLQVWSPGELPGGLSADTNYYVVNSTADAFELSLTSGGTPVTLTTDGSGTLFAGTIPDPLVSAMLLLIGHWHENRESTLVGTSITSIPMGVESLLMPYTSVRF